MSDGLTVPFALAAGLSGAVASNGIVVTAGVAEIAAGSIAMGLGGYLAAKTEFDHYLSEKKREVLETKEKPKDEEREVSDIFRGYGLADSQIEPILESFRKKPSLWVDFMMRFELGLERPDARRGRQSAFTIAFSYIVGGLVPLMPYMLIRNRATALAVSAALTLGALFVFGYVKAKLTGMKPAAGAFQTVAIGGLAALAAYAIAKFIS
jgi:VIT1/CCC1 family predicted Fe2+/Mn2+ transporter